MEGLSGSLRERTAEGTFQAVAPFAPRYGITRITDITRLDRIGIPVFASIRPGAVPGSLCVHNGKGVHPIEAKVGALMEAIEFELADPKRHISRVAVKRVDEIEDSFAGEVKFSDLGLQVGLTVSYSDQVEAVRAIDLLAERTVLLPAELVFLPYHPKCGRYMFGASSNGLASGNSDLEATIHAICEIVERHVRSLDVVYDRSQFVELASLPGPLRSMVEQIEAAGLDVSLRYAPNDFNLPFFSAAVMERSDYAPLAISGGYGLHPLSAIAASRALTEAAQSRLTCIHGGRDDVIDRFNFFATQDVGFEPVANAKLRKSLMRQERTIRFHEIPDYSASVSSISECYDLLVGRLESQGFSSLMRTVLSPADMPFSVVKVIIPQMEFCSHESMRMGPRMLSALEARLQE